MGNRKFVKAAGESPRAFRFSDKQLKEIAFDAYFKDEWRLACVSRVEELVDQTLTRIRADRAKDQAFSTGRLKKLAAQLIDELDSAPGPLVPGIIGSARAMVRRPLCVLAEAMEVQTHCFEHQISADRRAPTHVATLKKELIAILNQFGTDPSGRSGKWFADEVVGAVGLPLKSPRSGGHIEKSMTASGGKPKAKPF